MAADPSYSLEALERRWQLEKTPQVGLRLAEEYRRKGDLAASIEVLRAGLEVYPAHTSSRVALSRYLVDGERFDEAVSHLEQIVRLDPAHLVANKLLVGAYAGIGRFDDASDKLDIYEMMGEGDADIERLRALVEAARHRAAQGAAPERHEEPSPVEGSPALAVASRSEEPAFEALPGQDEPEPAWRADPEAPVPEVSRLERPAEAEPESPAELPAELPAEMEAELPFGVAEPEAGASGGLERALETLEPPDAAGVEDAPDAPEPALGGGAADVVFGAAEEPFGADWTAAEPSDNWREVEGEVIFAADAAVPAGDPSVATGSVEPPGDGPPESTVTMGELYLEQGYRREAADVFRKVLSREPGNEVAQRGLEAAVATVPSETDLPDAGQERTPGSRRQRRIGALTEYRARIRRAVKAGI